MIKNISLNLELGQTILVGQNNEPATITKIEFHEKSGEVNINTTKGPRKALTFRLCEQNDVDGCSLLFKWEDLLILKHRLC